MTQPNPQAVPFAGRIALVAYGLKELQRELAGLFAIEQMLRPAKPDEDADSSRLDLFRADLAELLATVNTALGEKTDFLIGLAEANQQEVMQ